ncbi:MAG: Zn-dependent exopeptidase M28, partial [Thermoplasmata archaeon]
MRSIWISYGRLNGRIYFSLITLFLLLAFSNTILGNESSELYQTYSNSYEDILSMINQLNESIYLNYLEDIVSFGPRVTSSPACEAAAEYIYGEFKKLGLKVRFNNFTYHGKNASNIEATIPGIYNGSDEIYIICAHYDSVTSSPGADDNGAGTCAVLSAAKVMSKYTFNHTVKFVVFAGEEQGLLGSHFYVVDAYENGDNIIGVLNADMIGYAPKEEDAKRVKVYYNDESEWLCSFTVDVYQEYNDYLSAKPIPSGLFGRSDHASFWSLGYDSIFYHEYHFNPNYHSNGDTIKIMNINYATNVSKLMLATLAELAEVTSNTPPSTPSISGPSTGKPGEEYQYSIETTDYHLNPIYYYIDWGDNTSSNWIGPYKSGEKINISHTWDQQGTFYVKVKAKDIYDAESDWTTLK